MPHHLYRPEISTKPEGFVQNTDPLVFGSSFLYTNCKQRGQGKLKHLAAGSIILFGSRVDRRFCLDTLFVVGSSQWYSPGLSPYPETLRQNSLIKEVTIEPISRADIPRTLRAYSGCMYALAETGPFSFIPCSTLTRHPNGFSRPTIELFDPRTNEDSIRHGMTQSYCGQVVGVERSRGIWSSIVNQVQAQGLLLGVSFCEPTPPEGHS